MKEANSVRGTVRFAKFLEQAPPFINREKLTGARAQGVRYEKKAVEKLQELILGRLDWELLVGPWLEFVDESGRRWCQPDAVFLSRNGKGLIVEVKYRHTADAWFQLWRLYVPVLERIFPQRSWQCCEMVRWYDPAIAFPESPFLTPDPLYNPHPRMTAVHIWNPSRD